MRVESDKEWDGLATQWTAAGSDEPDLRRDLRRTVRRQSIRLAILTVSEGLLVLALLLLSAVVATTDGRAVMSVWAAAIWILAATAWGFSLWNRRGSWKPAGLSTAAFLEVRHRRAVMKLRTVRFARWLLAAEVLFLIPWGAWEYLSAPERIAADPGLYILRYGLISLCVVVAVVWTIWYRRVADAEIRSLQTLRNSLAVLEGGEHEA